MHLLRTVFSSRLIHIWCSSEYFGQHVHVHGDDGARHLAQQRGSLICFGKQWCYTHTIPLSAYIHCWSGSAHAIC